MTTHKDRLLEAYTALNSRQKFGFLAGCISRTRDVLLNFKNSPITEFDSVIEILWSLMEGTSDRGSISALLETLSEVHARAKLERESSLSYAILTAVDGALYVSAPEAKAFVNAGQDAISVAVYTDERNHELAASEEREWQEQALTLLAATAEPKRDIFAGVGATPAQWVLRWEDSGE